ncbi:MAG TPA: hypothetical protein VKS21_06335 [Spirochaetota bacterium]|nr:hypothetical protein [Spirochaetota bacterium]
MKIRSYPFFFTLLLSIIAFYLLSYIVFFGNSSILSARKNTYTAYINNLTKQLNRETEKLYTRLNTYIENKELQAGLFKRYKNIKNKQRLDLIFGNNKYNFKNVYFINDNNKIKYSYKNKKNPAAIHSRNRTIFISYKNKTVFFKIPFNFESEYLGNIYFEYDIKTMIKQMLQKMNYINNNTEIIITKGNNILINLHQHKIDDIFLDNFTKSIALQKSDTGHFYIPRYNITVQYKAIANFQAVLAILYKDTLSGIPMISLILLCYLILQIIFLFIINLKPKTNIMHLIKTYFKKIPQASAGSKTEAGKTENDDIFNFTPPKPKKKIASADDNEESGSLAEIPGDIYKKESKKVDKKIQELVNEISLIKRNNKTKSYQDIDLNYVQIANILIKHAEAISDESFNIEKISAIFPKSNLKKIFILKPENDIYYPVQKHGFHKNSLTQFQLKSDNKIISKYLLNNKALYIKKHLLKKPFFKNHLQEKDFDEIDRIMLIPIKHKKNLVKIIGIAGVEI